MTDSLMPLAMKAINRTYWESWNEWADSDQCNVGKEEEWGEDRLASHVPSSWIIRTSQKSLTVRVPCSMIYSYNESQWDALVALLLFRNIKLRTGYSFVN